MKNKIGIFLSSFFLTLASCKDDDDVDHDECKPEEVFHNEVYAAQLQIEGGMKTVLYENYDGKMIMEYDIAIGDSVVEEKRRYPIINELIFEDKIKGIENKIRQGAQSLGEIFPQELVAHQSAPEALGVGRLGKNWKDGVFVYKIAPDFKNLAKLETAIETLKSALNGVISFRKWSGEPHYVEFINASGCWSYVGMQGGRQEIGLGDGCRSQEAMHEIGHALGLWHEQSRSDRQDFVDILWCNIQTENRHNFLRQVEESRDLGNYDYRSIMHYNRYAFSKNEKITMQSKTDGEIPLSNPETYSEGDIQALTCLYKEHCR